MLLMVPPDMASLSVEAVRVADMRAIVAEDAGAQRSTLREYLQLIGPIPAGSMFPNECRPYLAGVVSRGAQLKFLLRSGMLQLGQRESQKRRRGVPTACPARGGPEENAMHFVFTCGALHGVRDQLYGRLDDITAGAFGQVMYDEPLETVLLGLLGDAYWGPAAPAVDSCVRSFLVAAWEAHEAAVAVHAPSAASELVREPEFEPEVLLALRVRVPAPAAGLLPNGQGPAMRLCAECHSRRAADSMLCCQQCARWFHRSCGTVSGVVPADWMCSTCVSCCHAYVPGVFPTAHIPLATARGPMALALRPVQNLSFFLSPACTAPTASCTQRLPGPVTVVGSQYHTHMLGQRIMTRHVSGAGQELRPLGKRDFFFFYYGYEVNIRAGTCQPPAAPLLHSPGVPSRYLPMRLPGSA
jgi:hypothetical protein